MVVLYCKCISYTREGGYLKVKLTVLIQKEENWYVSKCLENLENNVAFQGKTIEDAISN